MDVVCVSLRCLSIRILYILNDFTTFMHPLYFKMSNPASAIENTGSVLIPPLMNIEDNNDSSNAIVHEYDYVDTPFNNREHESNTTSDVLYIHAI